MASVFDLHIHTTRGSSDSGLDPEEMAREAVRLGLTGLCLTEHGGGWRREDLERLSLKFGLVLVRALEVETDMGHILVFGLDGYHPGISSIRELRRVVRQRGGLMVAAHPFRHLFNPPPYNRNLLFGSQDPTITPREAASHPLFEMVDAIEVVNGANTEEENRFALEVARSLGLGGTGGSDAHSLHGLGKGVTVFSGEVRTEAQFLEALRAGEFRAGEGFHVRRLRYADDLGGPTGGG